MREVPLNGWRFLRILLVVLLVLAPAVAGLLAGSNAVSQAAVVLAGDGTTHTISASVVGVNGSISPSGAVPVTDGDSQPFTITPNPDYHVLEVLVDGISVGATESYTFPNVTGDHTISASFAINSYTSDLHGRRQRLDQRQRLADGEPRHQRHAGDGGGRQRLPLRQLERRRADRQRAPTNVTAANVTVTASFAINTYTSDLHGRRQRLDQRHDARRR